MSGYPGDEVDRVMDEWHRERPDVDVSSVRVLTPVLRLAALVTDNRARVLGATGLDPSHLDVLVALRRAGPPYRLTAGELSRRCRVTPGATTQRVAAMERLGYVRRVREEPDRRTVHVELTGGGRRRLDDVLTDVMSADERMLDGLIPAERRRLEDALRGWLRIAESRPVDG